MKKLLTAGLLSFGLLMVGCSQTLPEEVDEAGITHDLGSTVITETPTSIAVLEYSFLDALYRLGVNPIAIADDNEPQKVLDVTLNELTDYTSLGARKEPSLETLSFLDLDLIIADTGRHSQIYEDLNKLAPTISLTSTDCTYEQFIETFKLLAQIVDKEQLAEQILGDTEKMFSSLQEQLTTVLGNKKVLVVSPKNDKYTAHTPSSFVGTILEKAGVQNIIDSDDLEVDLSLEQLVELDPEVIIYMRNDLDTTIYPEWEQTDLYKQITAVQNNEVYTTAKKEYWTQYRGFASIEFIMSELQNWFLN